jgi:hypothetical protein
MPVPRDEWLRRRKAARQRTLTPSLESCVLTSRPDGSYDVNIRGTDLYLIGAIPIVEIGGRPVSRVTMEGHEFIKGIIDDGAVGEPVKVELDPENPLTTKIEQVS